MSTPPEAPRSALTLFVSGAAPRSSQAITTVRGVCDDASPDRMLDLSVVDASLDPARAAEYDVVALPTLVKVFPLPVRHLVQDLTDAARVRDWLVEVLPAPRRPRDEPIAEQPA